MSSGTPVREALQGATTAIGAAGSQTPRLDAELLLAHVLEVSRERLLVDRELRVAGPAVRAFQGAVRRRSIEREPVAYIIGRKGFRHIELLVDRRALIPRPETELLVEIGLTLPRGARVLDLCTGSGAVALALKHERPDLEVTGADLSVEALSLARENAARLELDVEWRESDLLQAIELDFDAVLANPPYVAGGEARALAAEIVRHEPHMALFAGPEGLDTIEVLLEQLTPRARTRIVALEVGEGQAERVEQSMRLAGFARTRVELDLAGIKRVVIGERA